MSRKFSWSMLFLAIFLEVVALTVMQAWRGWGGAVALLALMNVSYFCMSLCLRQIAVGVAYATWEILGGIGVLLISFAFFDPQISTKQLVGIFVGFGGILCVIAGERHGDGGAAAGVNSNLGGVGAVNSNLGGAVGAGGVGESGAEKFGSGGAGAGKIGGATIAGSVGENGKIAAGDTPATRKTQRKEA